ncbi:MAG: VTT domain-containing protein [Thermodesulfovibrionales bacterium]
MVERFLKECLSCGVCRDACPFLSEYGTPDEIIKEKPHVSFLCTNCRACDMVCPQGLSPSEAFLLMKHKLIKEDSLSEDVRIALNSAKRFAMRGHRFPFAYYSRSEKAFWPGCSLQGTRPDIVKKIVKTLNIGLVLDCCFDPLFQNGDLDEVKAATERIRSRLKNHGISHLILGCTNCKKIFSLYMPEIKTEHILEVMPEVSKNRYYGGLKEIYLHHPCPSFRFKEIRNLAEGHIKSSAKIISQATLPECCGLGGATHALSEILSNQFTERVITDSKDAPVVTYCMGCKNRFLKNGKEAYHILEVITDVRPLKKPVSSGRKWLNRFMLATGERLKNKKILFGIALLSTIILVTYLREKGYISPELIFEFIRKNKVLAPALFILIYAIGPSIFIPSLPLTLGAGFLWGPFWGVVFSITGATIGAFIPFLLSRYLLGDIIKERFGYARWQWLNEKVRRHGWKAVAFARLLPVLPFPVLNYLFGITPIPAFHYLWSTFVFMLPACIAYVAFGSSMEELIIKGNITAFISAIIIISLIMLMPFGFKRISKRLFREDDG